MYNNNNNNNSTFSLTAGGSNRSRGGRVLSHFNHWLCSYVNDISLLLLLLLLCMLTKQVAERRETAIVRSSLAVKFHLEYCALFMHHRLASCRSVAVSGSVQWCVSSKNYGQAAVVMTRYCASIVGTMLMLEADRKRIFCLSVCTEHNSKTNVQTWYIRNDLGIS